MVVTAIGEPEALMAAVLEAVGTAAGLIDLNRHSGQHPRMGAADVVPFIPLRGCTMEEAVALSKETGRLAGELYKLPVFLYEQSASAPHRENLADVRRGGFEGLDDKLRSPGWAPDFGPQKKHPTAGATAIGARRPLIAYNVNLRTDDLRIAGNIARRVRFSGGGLRCCKAIGVALPARGLVQVSMNLTDYAQTAIYRAFEMVRMEARRYPVQVAGSEIIGLVPLEALADTAAYYLGKDKIPLSLMPVKHLAYVVSECLRLDNFAVRQVLETRVMD
jgi:glutamate formiminotransferase